VLLLRKTLIFAQIFQTCGVCIDLQHVRPYMYKQFCNFISLEKYIVPF